MNLKSLLISTILTASTMVTSVSASTISGNLALNLRSSLLSAGAIPQVYTDATFVKVDKMNCTQEGGFLLMPVKCQFIENGRLIEVEAGNKSDALVKVLKSVGAKEISRQTGEYSKRVILVRAIECSTSMVPNFESCTLK